MATKTLKGKFLPQYRTPAQWSAADSVLLRGEIGVESDTRKFKFGDGTTSWNNLGYAQSGTTGGSGEAATYEPVEISEYGAIYDLTSLNEVPAGAIVTWYANGSVVDGDYGPFGGMAERVDGIYIAIKGSEDDTYRQGILLAFRTDGEEKSMAYAHISGGPGVGGVASAGDWAVYTPGGSSESGSGRTVVASGITWDGVQYKNVTVPMRAFSNQPNYIIRGYVGNANAAYAFSCETCGCLLSDGINFIASGIVRRSLTANTSLVVTANYVDPTEDNNPYREAAFDTLSIRLTDSSSDTTVVITEIIEEITTGGGVADDEPEVPDEYFLTVDGKTATGDGFAVTSHSLDSTAQMLELAYTTNGTPQIAAIAGEFLSAQIVGEEAAETQATETSGTIQIEVPQNTGLLRSGSVTLSLAEDESVQCTISISQSGGGLT